MLVLGLSLCRPGSGGLERTIAYTIALMPWVPLSTVDSPGHLSCCVFGPHPPLSTVEGSEPEIALLQ